MGKLTCQDLMVGDLVYIHEPECKGHRIDAIDELDGQVGADGEVYDECDIRPIKLTDDILVKNGFIFNKVYAVLQVSEDTYLDFYKHEHRLRKVWEGIDEWNNHAKIRDVTFVCQCYYVHEFQHALRLCGIEKELTI